MSRTDRKNFQKTKRKKTTLGGPIKKSLGELYKQIEYTEREVFEDDSSLMKRKDHHFVRFCKRVYNISPGMGRGAKFSDEYKSAVAFLNWNLLPEHLEATSKIVMIVSIIVGFVLSYIMLSVDWIFAGFETFAGSAAFLYIFGIPIALIYFVINTVQKYPLEAAKDEQKKALTYVPEIMGYMIMSLKLVPNLEKAIEFAAEHGKGKIAEELNLLLWNVQIGVFNTIAEGLDDLAYRWGKYSEELKGALMMVRASVIEDTEAKRYAMLDKTMTSVLESVKEKMEQYARNLSQPSVTLFYLGVLLPLILIIILPVGSAFTGQAMARPELMILIYNVIIPITAFLYARHTIKSRPPTYEPPKIDDNFPGLPRKGYARFGKTTMNLTLVVFLVLIVGIGASFVFSTQGLPPKPFAKVLGTYMGTGSDFYLLKPDQSEEEVLERSGYPLDYYDKFGPFWNETKSFNPNWKEEDIEKKVILEKTQFFLKGGNDTTPYNLVFFILITLSVAGFVFLNYSSIYKRNAQLEIISMESEFKDSLYVIASRMGENKPVEDAIKHTRHFLPNLKISERIFGRITDNITLLGLPLESAIFDKQFGAIVNMPSNIIKSGLKILVDSVNLGVNVAARTVISLSLQLENSDKVNQNLKVLVSDISGMMKSMSVLIAPAVLGITTALQKIVMLTLASVVGSDIGSSSSVSSSSMYSSQLGGFSGVGDGFLKADVFVSLTSPLLFLLIVGLYVLQLVIIMTYFTTKIEEDNTLLFKMNLAKNIPISMIVFLISVIVANAMVGGFAG